MVMAAYPEHEVIGGRYVALVDGRKVGLGQFVQGVLVLSFEGEQLAKKLTGG